MIMHDYSLHQIFAEKMGQGMAYLKRMPHRILCIGTDGGASRAVLKKICPNAEIDYLENNEDKIAQEMAYIKSQQNLLQRIKNKSINIFRQPENIPQNCYDCIWANMPLYTEQLFKQWADYAEENGVLFFSTAGNQTLKENPDLFKQNLPDIHDLGDIIQKNNWTDTVVDSENYTLTYETAKALINDIKILGLNDDIDEQKIIQTFSGSLKNISLEIIYAHAIKQFRQPETEKVVQFYKKNPYRE